jgi:MFS family permease
LAGVLILMPFYLENILRYDVMQVGLLMGVVPVMLGITSPIAGTMSDRLGTRPITIIGLTLMIVGFLSAGTLTQQTTAWGYLLRMFAVGLGIGTFISPNNSAIMGAAPRHQMGIASGFLAITRTLGQTVGVAVMGAIWAGRTAFYTGTGLRGDVTVAPVQAQIAALQDTFHVAAFLLGMALLLSVWAYVREQKSSNHKPKSKSGV